MHGFQQKCAYNYLGTTRFTHDPGPKVVKLTRKPLQTLGERPISEVGSPGDYNSGRLTFGMGVDYMDGLPDFHKK